MMAMADLDRAPDNGYSPEMDGATHEATYNGFVQFTAIGAVVVVCWVVALAIGGLKAAWLTAILGVVVAGVAGTVGALAPNLGWRAPAAVLAILLAILALS